MHWWPASITTATPLGCSTSLMVLAICTVSLSWICSRLAVGVHHARQLADADHPAVRQVGDVGPADDRHHVVLAVAFQADVAQQDDLVVALNLLEGPLQQWTGST